MMKNSRFNERLKEILSKAYRQRREAIGVERIQKFEQAVMLKVIDDAYRDHLYAMDRMKEGIGLRAYGQKDPLLEYKQEGFQMFLEYLERIRKDVLGILFAPMRVQEGAPSRAKARVTATDHSQLASFAGARPQMVTNAPDGPSRPKTVKREEPKVGRNEPCPCGSGKKYKNCHGKAGQAG
jgi:preprotein translocase subunit SecA